MASERLSCRSPLDRQPVKHTEVRRAPATFRNRIDRLQGNIMASSSISIGWRLSSLQICQQLYECVLLSAPKLDIHHEACTVCCVHATQPPTEPGRSTWERRTPAACASVCDASLGWGLASRAAHENTCPYGTQTHAHTCQVRIQALNDAKDVLKKIVETTQAIEGFPDATATVSAGVREKLRQRAAACNRALSAFEGDLTGTVVPLGGRATEESSVILQLRRFREEVDGVFRLGPEAVDQDQGEGNGQQGQEDEEDAPAAIGEETVGIGNGGGDANATA